MDTRIEYKDEDFSFHHTVSTAPDPQDEAFKSHFHDKVELYYFYGGSASYAVEGQVIPLSHGTLIVTDSGQAHNLLIASTGETYERMAILARPEALAIPPFRSTRVRILSEREQAWMEETVNLVETSDEKAEAVRAAASLILFMAGKGEDNAPGAPDATVRQIILFVNEHLTETWSLDTLAHTLFRDPAYLNRRFKRVMGCGIWEYTLRKRVFAARRHLLQTGRIDEAFARSGFSDYSSFFRRYKKTVGVSPSQDLKGRKTSTRQE